MKRDLFSSLAAAQKGFKTVIEKNGSFLDLGPLSVQLIRFDNIDHLDRTIVKESRKTEPAFCAVSGKTFGKESVLTCSAPKKSTTVSIGSTNIDQRILENVSMKDKTNNSTYKVHDNTTEEVSFL